MSLDRTGRLGVAAAGFAVSRLLLAPPDRPLVERMSDPAGRAAWPLSDATSLNALEIAGEGSEIDAVRQEWVDLLGPGTAIVEARESVRRGRDGDVLGATLTELFTAVGVAPGPHDVAPVDHLGSQLHAVAQCVARSAQTSAEVADEAQRVLKVLLVDHVGGFWRDVMDDVGARAHTPLLRALPGLVGGVVQSATLAAGIPNPAHEAPRP